LDKEEKDKLVALRKEIPVGIAEGLNLLNKAGENVEGAIRLFQEKTIQIIVQKTNVSKELALKHLEQNNFDIHQTLKSLEEELYSITERIFRKFKKKEMALGNVLVCIERVRNLERTYSWIDLKKLDSLHEKEKAFVIIQEWLNYESWEGTIYFHLNIATEAIRNALGWTEMVDFLQKLDTKAHDYQFFKDNETVFVEKLYDFVKENIQYFP